MLKRSVIRYRVVQLSVIVLMASIALAGCEPNQGKAKSDSPSSAKPAATPAKTEPIASTSPPPVAQPVNTAAAPKAAEPVTPPPVSPPPTKPVEPAASREWTEEKPLAIEEGGRRALAENMIYATIRIKMEEMIDQRSDLLKSGKAPSDVEVRQLEGSIMRARDLLMEAGEIVEDVQPPIVEVRAP